MRKGFPQFILLCFLSLVLSTSSFAHNKPDKMFSKIFNWEDYYDKAWKKVDSLTNKQLPQSALELVEEIYQRAKKEEQHGHFVKAIMYKVTLFGQFEEDALVKSIQNIEKECKTAQNPVKPLLHSLLAQIYWQYYENNRYQILNRSEIINYKIEDIRTWDMKKLVEATLQNHLSALEGASNLKNIQVDIFKEVIEEGNKMGRLFRPTAFDFIAHMALEFFENSESNLTQPKDPFHLNKKEFLADAHEFIQMDIQSEDSLSFRLQALKVLQSLVAFHKNDQDPSLWIHNDLIRLIFVHKNSNLPDRDDLLMSRLNALKAAAEGKPISASVLGQQARILYEQGSLYEALGNTAPQFKWKEALALCEEGLRKFPKSLGAQQCKQVKFDILEKTIQVQFEDVVPIDQPFPTLITYKNVKKVYWKVVKAQPEALDKAYEKQEDYDENLTVKFYNKQSVIEQWETELPDLKDYHAHSVEEKCPGLEAGVYVIMTSDNPDFSTDQKAVVVSTITVSNISYTHRADQDNGQVDVYVLHRKSGQPLEGVKVTTYQQKYDYKKRKYNKILLNSYFSDAQGYVKIPYQSVQNYELSLSLGNDQLGQYNSRSIYAYRRNRPLAQKRVQTSLFLDRRIYRPGQSIYFKGIVLEESLGKHKILPGHISVVHLYDVNGQKVTELEVKANEFGTYSGVFTAPDNGLNGNMRLVAFPKVEVEEITHTVKAKESLTRIARIHKVQISDIREANNLADNRVKEGQVLKIPKRPRMLEEGSISFSVEEYKRPKFFVEIPVPKGSYKFEEEVTISGNAKAYSGANIDGAEVTYRVVRQAYRPYWYGYYFRSYYSPPQETVMLQGTTQTDDQGKFEIKFKASPDLNFGKVSEQTCSYVVYADVTDLNGETHSQSRSLVVSERSLVIGLSLDNAWDQSEDLPTWYIDSNNLNGVYEASTGEIVIRPVKPLENETKTRLWDVPDQVIYDKATWKSFFPYDAYANELAEQENDLGPEVYRGKYDTESSRELKLEDLKNWPPGTYLLEITAKDAYGQEVKNQHTFEVYNSQARQLSAPEFFSYRIMKNWGEPGENARITLGTSLPDQAILLEIEHKGKVLSTEWLTLNKEQKSLEIPIKEEYRGNFAYHLVMIRENRFYNYSDVISVPYSNKDLDISFETYRDKLQPGEKEEWRIKIKGPKGEKVAAEMMATLYDASLDEFRSNYWSFNIYPTYYRSLNWNGYHGFGTVNGDLYQDEWNPYPDYEAIQFDVLRWPGYDYALGYFKRGRGEIAASFAGAPVQQNMAMMDVAEMEESTEEDAMMDSTGSVELAKKEALPPAPPKGDSKDFNDLNPVQRLRESDTRKDLNKVKARTNFNETAFFQPHLRTNEQGEVIVKFTIPESLTTWKMLGFAHTKNLEYGTIGNRLVTQKELMVVPNAPRYFREKDELVFSTKITNVSDKDLEGEVQLFLVDAINAQPIDTEMKNDPARKSFQIGAGKSTSVEWKIQVPVGQQAITYKVVAKAGKFSDGEEMTLPVLSNRMLVTETLPLPVRGTEPKNFKMEKLIGSASSQTLKSHQLSLEFTSNPAWYAVQALPYLMEFPYECAEQVFSRYYANALASHIANSQPRIQEVFNTWKGLEPDAMLSNLDKNQELKSLVLEETPWVLAAKNEDARKHRLGLLFDLNQMARSQNKALEKLLEKQVSSGAWTWFEGMPENRYITQYIVTGMGHLKQLGVREGAQNDKVNRMLEKARQYLDQELLRDYYELKRRAKKGQLKLEDQHIGNLQIQYLYARRYFEVPTPNKDLQEAIAYYQGQARKYWTSFNRYSQGMIALALAGDEQGKTSEDIVKSFRERALYSEELGMYWKADYGYYWYQAPIETQAMMVEVFDEVAQDQKAVDDLKTWLLKQKQTQDWKTTRATAEACYALLLRGDDWLAEPGQVEIKIGEQNINPYAENNSLPVEAGTGYFKTSWNEDEIKPDMGELSIKKEKAGVAWGALYWQYFEDLDKITTAETPLQLKKELFVVRNTDSGQVIEPINDKTSLKVGDKVKVRIELRVDRAMEYVHMKDMRAAGFEPINVISRYRYQGGLGYYESTRDAATHFFFDYLRKGTYVFEYPLRVNQAGDFSNGITSIQCMYAPEFSSHSEGIRVKVEAK